MHFCETNNISSQQQFGFHKRKGTDTGIAITYETIAVNQQHKNHCNVICKDVAKAFDYVWIEGLKFKILNLEDLPTLLKKVICRFTTNRTVQIKINLVIGPKFQLNAGVPQGNTLSLSFHILYS